MAARTTQKTGVASDNTVWDGGTALLDGDSFTIAAGHTLTWDWDKSAWTTGVAGITITSHASTPARLTFPTAAGTYTLPIKSGSSISGTAVTPHGQLYAGTLGSPQPLDAPVTILLLGTTSTGSILAADLDIQLFGNNVTTKYVRCTGANAGGVKALVVDTDVSAEWATGSLIGISDTKTDESEIYTLESFTGGTTINLPAAGGGLSAAKNAGAFICLITRSVKILHSANSATTQINMLSATVDCTFNVEYRNTACTTQANRFGRGYFNSARAGHVFGGTVWGSSITVSQMDGVCSGVFCNTGGLTSSTGTSRQKGRVTGMFIGGSVAMDSNGIVLESSALIACMTTGIRGDAYIAGKIIACASAIIPSSVTIHQTAVIGGSGNDANTQDILFQAASNPYAPFYVEGFGAGLRSTSQVASGYLAASSDDYVPGAVVVLYDVADSDGTPQPGRLAWWSQGGSGKSETYVVGTHGTPPVTLAYVHKSNFETVNARNYLDIPVLVPKGQTLTATVWVKKSANGMTVTPKFSLIDKNREWGHANEYLSSSTMTDDTNWQTITLTYTASTEDKQIALRAEGRNASGSMYWDYDLSIATAGAGGGCVLFPALGQVGVGVF